ncbi:MAG TPA: AAA family ATPase [Bdellovibrionota bacterium]|nr:AAA family ATPase [Bdellovibrionota bacterium]
MKIIRLELFGFKSFVEKTVVSFDQPITAIVGSNGCGKSNIVDALYWVMGDMSPKHLRGTQMTDVIFSGSKDHPALDMAEVTLVLELEPEKDPELPAQFKSSNEVGITRRYYRSGESEYFINKIPCRLRDVQEFFMDTGCGAKSYSIIEQGAITRMVAQKPEERRRVIEDVAGILKFKARKAETERKLENSRTNLRRIDDILKDLQKQLTSLKRQADKAEKYKILMDELRELEICLAGQEWLRRSGANDNDELLTEDLQTKRESLQAKAEALRIALEEAHARLSELEPQLISSREATRSAELLVKDTESKISSLETRKHTIQERVENDRSQVEDLEARASELEKLIEELNLKIFEALEGVETQIGRTDALREELEASKQASESARDSLQKKRSEAHQEELAKTRVVQEIQSLQSSLAQTANRRSAIEELIESLRADLETNEAERSTTMQYLEEAFSTRGDLEAAKEVVDQKIHDLDVRRTELLEQRNESREELAALSAKREQLEALERELEGVEATNKSLVKEMRDQGFENPMLAAQIKVPELLERAVETALGKHLQRICVSDMDGAENLRMRLAQVAQSEARQGRASMWIQNLGSAYRSTETPLSGLFLAPATTTNDSGIDLATHVALEGAAENGTDGGETRYSFDPEGNVIIDAAEAQETFKVAAIERLRSVETTLLEDADVMGPLSQLVNGEGSENADWSKLVEGVWVVRDREALLRVQGLFEFLPVDLVSLDGDLLTREGFLDLAPLEASQDVSSSSLVRRRRHISELAARGAQLDTQLAQVQSDLDTCVHDLQAAKEEFRNLTGKLAALNPDVEKHSSFLRQVEAKAARLSEKQTMLGLELKELSGRAEEHNARLEECLANLESIEVRSETLAADVETQSLEVQALLEKEKSLEAQLIGYQNELRSSEKIVSDLRSELATHKQELHMSQSRRERSLAEIDRLSAEVAQIEDGQGEAREALETQKAEYEIHAEKEVEVAHLVDAERARVRQEQKNLDLEAAHLSDVLVQLKDIDQRLAVNRVELRNVSDRLMERYQIALEDLSREQIEEMSTPTNIEMVADVEAGKQHAKTLRDKIDKLGKINMVAIEEFEEISRRHEYLFIQRQDVWDGVKQLEDAIERIDRESKQRFAEAFEAVNGAFRTTFPVLFGGGHAELKLTDPDNLLETGVEIVAQPPGKKLQSVTLLSGGEKALTAVSLIFGIFSIKPSPFCVLDEVDAPLDDTNVSRFNKQVRNMALSSQIIMITHHKKTMESSDALFGVTMEKPGISKVASARLGNIESKLLAAGLPA